MNEHKNASPEEVCRAVATDLRARGITHEEVGKTIGKSRSLVSNALSSKKGFSKQMANLLSRAYGYNINYLLYGEGEFKSKQILHELVFTPSAGVHSDMSEEITLLASLVNCAEGIIRTVKDKNAMDAWQALTRGDFDGYIKAMARMSKEHGRDQGNPILARVVCERTKGLVCYPITSDLSNEE